MTRTDEIGNLSRVMHAMSSAIHSHIAALQLSEANLRQLNQDLAGSEAKYRSIVDHAPFGIFTPRGMTRVFSNRYNGRLAGLDPREEKDPDAVRRAIHPEDRERVIEEFAQAVAEAEKKPEANTTEPNTMASSGRPGNPTPSYQFFRHQNQLQRRCRVRLW